MPYFCNVKLYTTKQIKQLAKGYIERPIHYNKDDRPQGGNRTKKRPWRFSSEARGKMETNDCKAYPLQQRPTSKQLLNPKASATVVQQILSK